MSLRTVKYLLSNVSKLKLLSITTICYYANLIQVTDDLAVLDDIVSTKVHNPRAFRCHINGFTNEIPIEEIMPLLQNFPNLNFIHCEALWSDHRSPNCIGFTLASIQFCTF